MNLANFGAVRRLLLVSAVLTLSPLVASAQIVERSQTWANLIATHPCNAGLNGRHTILTDAQSSSSIGGGGGSTRVFVECDGVDTWSIVSIGGSGGGVSGLTTADGGTALSDNAIVRGDGTTGVQGSTVTVADSTGNLQWEGTTADAFEGNFTFADPTADWTWAWGAQGDLVGAGSLSIDNLKLDGNTISTTDTNGNINLTPNGTGQVVIPVGDGGTKPGIVWAGDTDTGFRSQAANWVELLSGGAVKIYCNLNGCFLTSTLDANGSYVIGARGLVEASTAGSGSPNVLATSESSNIFSNEGSTAVNYHTLPTAAAGYEYTFCVQDSDGLRVTASTGDTIRSVASVTSSGGYIESTTIGSCIVLRSFNATEWMATSISGTWSFN